MSDAEARVPLGIVTRPHGLRGEVRLRLHNPGSEALVRDLAVQLVSHGGEGAPIDTTVDHARPLPSKTGMVVLKLAGCDTVEEAEELRGAELLVLRDDLPPLDDEEYYVTDLVGLEVRGTDGAVLGTVVEVAEYPSMSCLCVRTEEGVLEVPMMEPWLVDVDMEGGFVSVGSLEDVPVQPRGKGR